MQCYGAVSWGLIIFVVVTLLVDKCKTHLLPLQLNLGPFSDVPLAGAWWKACRPQEVITLKCWFHSYQGLPPVVEKDQEMKRTRQDAEMSYLTISCSCHLLCETL